MNKCFRLAEVRITYDNGRFTHRQAPGSIEELVAKTLIACMKEAETLGIMPQELLEGRGNNRTAHFRGRLIVYMATMLGRLGQKSHVAKTVSDIFSMARTTVLYYQTMEKEGVDAVYKEIAESSEVARARAYIILLEKAIVAHPEFVKSPYMYMEPAPR